MATEAQAPATESTLEGGSYEVIRGRLLAQAKELGAKVEALNERRRVEFGGQELTVIGTERVRTENNCVPRNIVPVGGSLLLGFNVFMGLKQERAVSDVFSLHAFARTPEGGFDFSTLPNSAAGGFLEDKRFTKDFEELFKFYKDARLDLLTKTDARLLAVFRTGQTERDVKVLRFSVDPAGRVAYVDNRGEGDVHRAPSHDFAWTQATRENFVSGRHPHVNVLDEVFIETVGGDLTVKVENNSESGQGIYSEPVDEPTQSLDDAEFHYAKLGVLVLLKVKPFREEKYRYLVFNTRTSTVARVDAIGVSCVQLPEDQGVIFPGGYVLQTGEVKVFESDVSGLEFKRSIKSPNGEDVLYVFYDRAGGRYVLLPYNLVRKEVASPIHCHGYSIFADGQMVVFRSTSNEPTRVHPMQVWQTPFVSAEFAAALPTPQTALGKLGNAELVRGISEVLTVKRMAESEKPTRRSYEGLISTCQRIVDAFHWVGQKEIDLLGKVQELKKSAELIVDEFEKVLSMQKRASEELAKAVEKQEMLLRGLTQDDLRSTDSLMTALASLRQQRGVLITLKEIRYMDAERVDGLEAEVVAAFEQVSTWTVEFLLTPAAFQPLHESVAKLDAEIAKATKTPELKGQVEEVERLGTGLTVLGEVVGGLSSGDATQKAKILEDISEVFSKLNRVRATVQGRRKELLGHETRAEFTSQFKLFAQSIDSALALADSPEKVDEQLGKLSVQLEELESRFSDVDEFAGELAQRREELFDAFARRRQVLVDERQRKAANLFGAAERVLQGITRRAASFTTDDELNAYFASDPTAQKLKQFIAQLIELKDPVKSDELDSRLKTAKQEALRSLRDKKDLFEGGTAVVRFGPHRFNVNTQPLEATVLPKDDGLFLHLTGSDYFQRLNEPAVEAAKAYWDQTLPSESPDVARAEYLASSLLTAAQSGKDGLSFARFHELIREGKGLQSITREAAQGRYDEGYERGVHDVDAARILEALLTLHESAGLLRYDAWPRVLATLAWAALGDDATRKVIVRRAQSLGRLKAQYGHAAEFDRLADDLTVRIGAWAKASTLDASVGDLLLSGRYLAEELAKETQRFVVSRDAMSLREALLASIEVAGQRRAFEEDLRAVDDPAERFKLTRAWLEAYVVKAGTSEAMRGPVLEAAGLFAVEERQVSREVSSALLSTELTGLLSNHPRVQGQKLSLRLDEFERRLARFVEERLPAYQAFRAKVREVIEHERKRLRIDELRPKVLSSFVRNRLIDEVYLPLIGANLAKQLGTAGENKRTDRNGLLLLVSPPGYGKTTLMEYVASRLGLTFVKVNGPALGHEVVSVDPADAPNSTAKLEVERMNFSFELGNNVMLYLDDIQHTNPELLQKFISLCDAQRKIEGVWNGVTRTYDLRGKRFCVVMAGNPYTESGEVFKIPDMLANRADTYNLGDILSGKDDLFALSYLENALTANTVTAPLTTRPPADIPRLLKMAQGQSVATTELEHGYSGAELNEIIEVLKRLFFAQRVLLRVNQQYIASASQDDRFRTEPPFKLQGSYRNMNKLAEKIVAVMTDPELETLIDSHYAGESQTLTTSAEQNLLKLAELRGRQTADQKARWDEIKRGFKRVQTQGGKDDDPVVRVTGTLAALGEELSRIREAAAEVARRPAEAPLAPHLEALSKTIAATANKPRQSDLGPKLDALREAVLSAGEAMKSTPPVDLRPVLKTLAEANSRPPIDLSPALNQLAQVAEAMAQRAQAQQIDLTPVLNQLTEVTKLVLERPEAAPQKDFGPLLEKLAAQQSAAPARPAKDAPASDEVRRQLSTLSDTLSPIAAAARSVLQVDSDGAMKAVVVWQQVNEAIQLVRALEERLSGRPRRKQ
ncbi:MAG: DNA repair ATPase [Myxococcales bacterium]|nr:DNA repair ATPase [Myxococcales bacterium]